MDNIKLNQTVYVHHNYKMPNISYIKDCLIYEYDMINAGLNILYYNDVFSKDQYNELNKLSKLEKNKKVGLFLKKHSDISKSLMEEFINIRYNIMVENNLNDEDILAIKKDAIFTINKELKNTKLNDYYIFTKKNTYTSYLRILNNTIECYNNKDKLDTKGFKKSFVKMNKDYLINDIHNLMNMISKNNIDEAYTTLLKLKYDFLNRSLPYQYYYDYLMENFVFKLINDEFMYLEESELNNNIKNNLYINNNLNLLCNLIVTILC